MKIKYPNLVLKKTTSTIEVARGLERISEDFLVIASFSQTKGKGRFSDRYWFSPENSGVYVSLIVKKLKNNDILEYVTKILALSVIEYLKNRYQKNFYIKIPNDIYLNGKKISGVLAESSVKGNEITKLIMSFGVNLLKPKVIPEDLKDKIIYISDFADVDFKRDFYDIINGICDNVFNYLNFFSNNIDEKFNSYLL